MRMAIVLGIAIITIGCANPNAPSEPRECVMATQFVVATGQYVDYGIMIPVSKYTSGKIMPDSFCR